VEVKKQQQGHKHRTRCTDWGPRSTLHFSDAICFLDQQEARHENEIFLPARWKGKPYISKGSWRSSAGTPGQEGFTELLALAADTMPKVTKKGGGEECLRPSVGMVSEPEPVSVKPGKSFQVRTVS